MQQIIYKCDFCDRILSDGKIEETHISIAIGHDSGFYNKDQVTKKFKQGIFQFCDSKCFSSWLENISYVYIK